MLTRPIFHVGGWDEMSAVRIGMGRSKESNSGIKGFNFASSRILVDPSNEVLLIKYRLLTDYIDQN